MKKTIQNFDAYKSFLLFLGRLGENGYIQEGSDLKIEELGKIIWGGFKDLKKEFDNLK